MSTASSSLSPPSRVLLVEDNEAIRRAHSRGLARFGFEVRGAENGVVAIDALINEGPFDVILSDVEMPEMSGMVLLERIRAHDLDVPVVMVTGTFSPEIAARAINHGALRYLVKPVSLHTLTKVTADAVRLHQLAKAKRKALDLLGNVDRLLGDSAGLATTFNRALESLHIVYQPIVRWSDRTTYAYEALMRSREPLLPTPSAMLHAATRLDRIHDLGRRIRSLAVARMTELPTTDCLLFLNLHPSDLEDDALLNEAVHPERIVLEVTERTSLHDVREIQQRVEKLRRLGYRLAIDDLGAGYAGLTSFALLEPEIVKLDMALVRDLHKEPTKQTVVRTMVTMCRELGIVITAEGIEAVEERDELVRLGCDLLQGYLFARPGATFPTPTF